MGFATVCKKCGESWFCECGGFNQLAEDRRRSLKSKLNIMEGKRLIYDVAAKPEDMTIEEVMDHYEKTGVALYDSRKGPAPQYLELKPEHLHDRPPTK